VRSHVLVEPRVLVTTLCLTPHLPGCSQMLCLSEGSHGIAGLKVCTMCARGFCVYVCALVKMEQQGEAPIITGNTIGKVL
jgi:hypothetical protein